MKKWWICLLLTLFLTGCAAEETLETVADELLRPAMAPVGEIVLTLPQSASQQTMVENQGDKLYFCDGYTVTVQTMDRGDLVRTAKSLCGYSPDSLDIVETVSDGNKRWDWVWTCAGEGGDLIGRASVIDDGNYHYCVTVMADAGAAGKLETEWNKLLGSFAVG